MSAKAFVYYLTYIQIKKKQDFNIFQAKKV